MGTEFSLGHWDVPRGALTRSVLYMNSPAERALVPSLTSVLPIGTPLEEFQLRTAFPLGHWDVSGSLRRSVLYKLPNRDRYPKLSFLLDPWPVCYQ